MAFLVWLLLVSVGAANVRGGVPTEENPVRQEEEYVPGETGSHGGSGVLSRLERLEITLSLTLQQNEQMERRLGEVERKLERQVKENVKLMTSLADDKQRQKRVQKMFYERIKTSCQCKCKVNDMCMTGHSNEKTVGLDAETVNFDEIKPENKSPGKVYVIPEKPNDRQPQISATSGIHARQLPPEGTVAFTAVVSKQSLSNLGRGHTILFDQAVTNVGNAYHTTTGIFTAPISGIYVFHMSMMMDRNQREYLYLVKDGATVVIMYDAPYHDTETSSRLATLQLSAGSEVWVKTGALDWQGTGVIHGNGFTSFSGFLLAPTE